MVLFDISEKHVTTFNLKKVTIPLFGEVEKKTTRWFDTFSASGATTPVQIDDAALDIIAEELELDAEGLAGDADRYVSGQYRAKARGLSGARLGDLGEILTFLANRAVPGREIVRVVSWRPGAGQTVKDSRFPQPDFIIKDPDSAAAALEVKSTEAFDFIDLRDKTKRWTFLQPCASVGGCREQALHQLAYMNGSLTPQQHSLVKKGGKVVPFPVAEGVAAAVLAVDGRVHRRLRSDPRFKTPPACRDASRDCWSCVSETCHFALVTMPNAPGALSLAGADREGSTWLRAYRRWSQALAARDLLAVQSALHPLVEAVVGWLDQTHAHEPNLLRAFWGSYVGDAMRSRGFRIDVPGELSDLGNAGMDFGWSPAPVAQVANRETTIDEVERYVAGEGQDVKGELPAFVLSARPQRAEEAGDSLSVGTVGEFLEFRLTSSTWWNAEQVASTEAASKIAARLFTIALQASRHQMIPHAEQLPLREVVAHVGEQAIPLGWESEPATPGSDPWRRWCDWPFLFDHPRRWPSWQALLALGDPRIRLRVQRDGRADLRVHKALLRRWE